MPKTVKFTCPWCFETVDSLNLHFRCHPNTRATKDVDFLDEVDKAHDTFMRSVGGDTRGDQAKALTKTSPGVHPEIITTTIDGKKCKIITGLHDRHKNTSVERLCPHCHNILPASCGKAGTKVVSIIGYTQIGKSVYMISLLELLKNKMSRVLPGASFGFINYAMGEYFSDRSNELDNGTLKTTNQMYIEPIIGEMTLPNKNTLLLSFYDFPGELNTELMRKFAQKHIDNADAWLYLFDLTRTKTWWEVACDEKTNQLQLRIDSCANASKRAFWERKMEMQKMLRKIGTDLKVDEYGTIKTGHYLDACSWLTERLQNVLTEKSKSKKEKDRPIAVVGTKSDEIAAISEELLEMMGDEEAVRSIKSGIAALQPVTMRPTMDSVNQIHQWMTHKDGLLRDDIDLQQMIGKISSINHYFAVSSLGCAYRVGEDEYGNETKELPYKRDPWRVADPLLWLLDALGLYSIR